MLSPDAKAMVLASSFLGIALAFQELKVPTTIRANTNFDLTLASDTSISRSTSDARSTNFRVYLSTTLDNSPLCILAESASVSETTLTLQIPASAGSSDGTGYSICAQKLDTSGKSCRSSPKCSNGFAFTGGLGDSIHARKRLSVDEGLDKIPHCLSTTYSKLELKREEGNSTGKGNGDNDNGDNDNGDNDNGDNGDNGNGDNGEGEGSGNGSGNGSGDDHPDNGDNGDNDDNDDNDDNNHGNRTSSASSTATSTLGTVTFTSSTQASSSSGITTSDSNVKNAALSWIFGALLAQLLFRGL